MKMADFEGMSVKAVRDLVSRTKQHIEGLEERAKQKNLSQKDVDKGVAKVVKGAKATADDIRSGSVASKDIGAKVSENVRKSAAHFETPLPEFHKMGSRMANKIGATLFSDDIGKKLREVESAMRFITSPDDLNALEQIDSALCELSNRADNWRTVLKRAKESSVVPLKSIEGGK